MRWFQRGDIDGFFGLVLDNMVQLLMIDVLCRSVLGFSDGLLYGRVLPAVAVSLVIGNLFYAFQARHLARRTGRNDVCALPYGINTPSLIAFLFLVMLPAKLQAEAAGHPDPAEVAWLAGLIACVGSGLIEFLGAFVAERIRRSTPRAALLATLAGVALGFISLGFLMRAYARPLVGLTTFAVVLMAYFGKIRFRGGLPGGLVAILIGTLLAWISGIAPVGETPKAAAFYPPQWVGSSLRGALEALDWTQYLSVILPMGIINLLGSLQNIESAEAAGDAYATGPSLAVNGLGSMAAGLFGSCFPTTIYIGHPGWKAMGARAGYSVLNAVFFTGLCLTGTVAWVAWAVPIDAGMAIVIWIGIIITAQAFQTTPTRHAPAVVMGILPGVAAWGALMAKNGLRAAGYGTPEGPAFGAELIPVFQQSDTWIHGAFALEQGFILTGMLLGAITVEIIERRFQRAAVWSWLAAALSAAGLIHAYRFTAGDTAVDLRPAWEWAAGYAVMGLLLFGSKWIAESESPVTSSEPTEFPRDGDGDDEIALKRD